MAWRVAESLDVLLAEVDAAAPRRSKISDGSIGDAAHASRDSDHNPWVIVDGIGVVRARDFTHDPAGGFSAYAFAQRIAEKLGKHPALMHGAYVISNRKIMSFDRLGEGWRPYTGSNPHDHHTHVSVSLAEAGFDSTKPWGVVGAPQSEEDFEMNKDEAKALFREVLREELGNQKLDVGKKAKWSDDTVFGALLNQQSKILALLEQKPAAPAKKAAVKKTAGKK